MPFDKKKHYLLKNTNYKQYNGDIRYGIFR